MLNLDEMIMATTAQPVSDDKIRLKYLAIAGGTGPELTLTRELAEQTIQALNAALAGKAYDSDKA